MKKIIFISTILLFMICCKSTSDVVERFLEDSVEVVHNRIKPYSLEGEPENYSLEEQFAIDLENNAVSSAGLYKMDSFGVDFEGNVYIVNQEETKDHIFKFRNRGQFESSFGRHGQGPGELMRPPLLTVTGKDEVIVCDILNAKIVQYREDGSLVREIPTKSNIMAFPLKNGNYMVMGRLRPDLTAKFLIYPMELCDGDFNFLKLLEEFKLENVRVTQRLRGTPLGFGFSITQNRIFTGNEERNYEIWEFDLEGNLTRKIRKDYKHIPIPDEFKKERLNRLNKSLREIAYFADEFPPFQALFSDEAGYLFVLTFEKDESGKGYLIDIFNPSGAFVGRMSADILVNENAPVSAIIRHGLLYYIQEKENGYRRFVAEKIIH